MYKLYWNNVCLVTKLEEKFLENRINELRVDINIEYFGLGRKETLLDRITNEIKNKRVEGDIIISSDTDVFQNSMLIPSINGFREIKEEINICKEYENTISKCNRFVPFIVIPLVLVYNKKNTKERKKPKTYLDLINDEYINRYSIGGLHNSAGKSIIKSIWYKYGEETASKFLENSQKHSMPAAAFNSVKKGKADYAIVPTIFAKRANKDEIGIIELNEGAIPIPSYIAIKKNIDFNILDLITMEFINLLRKNACIISTFHKEDYMKLLMPSYDFLNNLDHKKLTNLMNKYLK